MPRVACTKNDTNQISFDALQKVYEGAQDFVKSTLASAIEKMEKDESGSVVKLLDLGTDLSQIAPMLRVCVCGILPTLATVQQAFSFGIKGDDAPFNGLPACNTVAKGHA